MVESDASTLLERLRPWGLSSFPLEREKTENGKNILGARLWLNEKFKDGVRFTFL